MSCVYIWHYGYKQAVLGSQEILGAHHLGCGQELKAHVLTAHPHVSLHGFSCRFCHMTTPKDTAGSYRLVAGPLLLRWVPAPVGPVTALKSMAHIEL